MRTRSLLTPRAAAVLALIDSALGGNVVAVHDFRVAARSLRAGLQTLAAHPRSEGVRKTRRALQVAIRRLADTRDRDVGRALLLKRRGAAPEHAVLRRRLLGLVESDRRMALARCARAWPRKLDARLIALLLGAEPSVETVLRRTRAEAFQQRGRALVLIAALGRRYDPLRLHELRRRVRSLRYALEALAEVDRGAQSKVARLKPLQSALGDIQDYVVLEHWLNGQAVRFRRSDPVLAASLREAAHDARARSKEAHRRFLALGATRVLERLALHVDSEGDAPLSASVPPRHRLLSNATLRGGRAKGGALLAPGPHARASRRIIRKAAQAAP